ncbi:hypothetical protein SLA2020_242880 [Shorea laevis]
MKTVCALSRYEVWSNIILIIYILDLDHSSWSCLGKGICQLFCGSEISGVQKEAMLKEELRNMERMQKREGVDMTSEKCCPETSSNR